MVSYELNATESGDCEIIARKLDREIRKLWRKQKSTGNEWTLGFRYNGKTVEPGGFREGTKTSIQFIQVDKALDPLLDDKGHKKGFRYGNIHTHPTYDGITSFRMTPGDILTVMRFIQVFHDPLYKYSYVVTQDSEDELVLFGIELEMWPESVDGLVEQLQIVRDDYTTESGDITNPEAYSREITDIISTIANICTTRIRL